MDAWPHMSLDIEVTYEDLPPYRAVSAPKAGHLLGMELVPVPLTQMSTEHHSRGEWNRLRHQFLGSVDPYCQACGTLNEWGTHQVHEVWAYDDEPRTQTLAGLQLLCSLCHHAKHWCPDQPERGRRKQVKTLALARGWDEAQMNQWVHAERAKSIARIARACAKGRPEVTRLFGRLNGWDTGQVTQYVVDKTWEWYRRNDYDDWTQDLGPQGASW